MNIIIAVLAISLVAGIPILIAVLIIKRKAPPMIGGPIGPRRHDGALSYDEYRGIRFNVSVEDPRNSHNRRYQRRHAARTRKATKPWMKQ